jgi:hypothetical protein
MADIVDLRTRQPTSHDDEFNSQLVQDLARYSEGLVSELDIRRRYKFDESTWNALGENETLFAAIEDEKVRRIRNGQQKRERSQKLVTQAPNVLSEILCSKDANPRHRIDAARTLDDFSVDKPEAAAATDRFVINIVLNADNSGSEPATLHFNKRITPLEPNEVDPLDSSPDDLGSAPQELLAVVASKKPTDGGDGQPL